MEVSSSAVNDTIHDSSAALPVLRRLVWPSLVPVDLRTELPWLILHEHESLASIKPSRRQEDDVQGASPYHQSLRKPSVSPPALSPAQRAAKKILKLREEMELLPPEEESQHPGSPSPAKTTQIPGSRTTPPPSSTRKPPASDKKPRSPTTKASRQARAFLAQQQRLSEWVKRDEQHQHRHQFPIHSDKPATLSMEMEESIRTRMTATLGLGLWDDPVASLIAAEMTSESVFGGFVDTRRLRYEDPERSARIVDGMSATRWTLAPAPAKCPSDSQDSPDSSTFAPMEQMNICTTDFRDTIVKVFADEVRDDAQTLVAEGCITEALETLQDGITRILHDFHDNQDEIQAHGFNYSIMTHKMATKIQVRFKARHRLRVANLVRIQRIWRRFRAHCRFVRQRAYQTRSAIVIQRAYKPHYRIRHREKSASRIQRCFRIYQEQKHLILLHRACRMLNARERRRRELLVQFKALKRRLWSKLKFVLKFIWLHMIRFNSIARLQSHWRGWKARVAYSQRQKHLMARESDRRRDEDAFVEQRLRVAMQGYSRYLRSTRPGRNQVSSLVWKRWTRWTRTRKTWYALPLEARAEAMSRLYNREVIGGVELQGVLVKMQQGKSDAERSRHRVKRLVLRPDELISLIQLRTDGHDDNSECKPPLTSSRGWKDHARHLVDRGMSLMHQIGHKIYYMAMLVLWYVVFEQKQYFASVFSSRRRCDARLELEESERRILRSYLRHVYRSTQSNSMPKYACDWCLEGFATSKEFYAHLREENGCSTQKRQWATEWEELHADYAVISRQRPRWWPIKLGRAPERDESFSLDAAWVQNVVKARSNGPALRILLDAVITPCLHGGHGAHSDSSSVVLLSLLAHLLQPLDITSFPSLSTHLALNTQTWTTTSSPDEASVGFHELRRRWCLPEGTNHQGRWMDCLRVILKHFRRPPRDEPPHAGSARVLPVA